MEKEDEEEVIKEGKREKTTFIYLILKVLSLQTML
jgi:hypothetical protein